MKNFPIGIFLPFLLVGLLIRPGLSAQEDEANNCIVFGYVQYKLGKFSEAAATFEDCVRIEKAGPKPRPGVAGKALASAAKCYESLNLFEKAIGKYEEALVFDRQEGDEGKIALRKGNLAIAYTQIGRYAEGSAKFEEAIAIFRKRGQTAELASALGSLCDNQRLAAKFDQALKACEEGVRLARNLGNEELLAMGLGNTGGLYYEWGVYDQALKYSTEARDLNKKLGRESVYAMNLNNIASIYRKKMEFGKALDLFQQARAIHEKLGEKLPLATNLNNIGGVYLEMGQLGQAAVFAEQGINLHRELGLPNKTVDGLDYLAKIGWYRGDYPQAQKYWEECLALNTRTGAKGQLAANLHHVGLALSRQGRPAEAVPKLKQSINLFEELRRTATGDARRDYFAQLVAAYENVIAETLKLGNLPELFRLMEISRARVLAEQLASAETEVRIPSIPEAQASLPPGAAELIFANTWHEQFALLVLAPKATKGLVLSSSDFVKAALETYQEPIAGLLAGQRGMKLKAVVREEKKEDLGGGAKPPSQDFENIVNYYRTLLANPAPGNADKARELGRRFYDLLIKPAEEIIRGKNEIIIIPHGILAFIPFETLVDGNGDYLVEKFQIKYAQSVGVTDLIKARKYPSGRKPLLAFGGAVYNEVTYGGDMVTNGMQLARLENTVAERISGRGSVRDAYGALNIGSWSNLPGTLNEVRTISGIVPGASIFTGDQVTENKLKELSRTGELAQYQVLHFATHGLVVPSLPELSAVVLSQFQTPLGNEDGYLRMGEVAELKLKADFVNLSACETGLGKIYGGEGVVGLTQSFLVAGANGLSVSLWQVADESTMKFMTGVYQLVEQKKIGYGAAMTEMKRAFISGAVSPEPYDPEKGVSIPSYNLKKKNPNKYSDPYFWAPFVYYGL